MVKTSPFNVGGRGMGLIVDQGANIPCTLQPEKKKKRKQKQYCNKLYKGFLKNGPH